MKWGTDRRNVWLAGRDKWRGETSNDFSLGCVEFMMPVWHPRRDTQQVSVYVGLELRRNTSIWWASEVWMDEISHGEGVEGEESGTCKSGKQHSRDCPRTRGKSDHFAMKEKFHARTKRQGTTTMYISFSTEKNTFFNREKYLTFHEVFKNSNTCYLWNIWKVQEGIKKYQKEKNSKDYFCEFCGLSPIFFCQCAYTINTATFSLTNWDTMNPVLDAVCFLFPLTLYLKHFPTYTGTLNNWIERKIGVIFFFEKENHFREK